MQPERACISLRLHSLVPFALLTVPEKEEDAYQGGG